MELLSKFKNPTEEQIRAHLSGHMCKCSAYPNIVKSVQAAAKLMT
ncbi:MAG TPA: 2Fe-2S iron-sulfur cluster-binding protein [Anaerolineae bacterium]